jgi:hypothetical protein
MLAYYSHHRPFTSCVSLCRGNYDLKCKFVCFYVDYIEANLFQNRIKCRGKFLVVKCAFLASFLRDL